MKIHILGLFPEMAQSFFDVGLLKRAQENQLIKFYYHQLRDWSNSSYNAVDDKPYGGGQGMVFKPDVVCSAVREIQSKQGPSRVILTSPAGKTLTPDLAKELAREQSLTFLCGRYEGVDQRAIDLVVNDEISIGDYVLTGGELAAAVMTDVVSRYIPGVVGKESSVQNDSHEDGLLEYPHYTRPENFEGLKVPEVLLSGHHDNIDSWRRKESLRKTWDRRPDLLKKTQLTAEELELVKSWIHSKKV